MVTSRRTNEPARKLHWVGGGSLHPQEVVFRLVPTWDCARVRGCAQTDSSPWAVAPGVPLSLPAQEGRFSPKTVINPWGGGEMMTEGRCSQGRAEDAALELSALRHRLSLREAQGLAVRCFVLRKPGKEGRLQKGLVNIKMI